MWLHARGGCNGKFAAAHQYGISVLARNVVFADPWLGRRGNQGTLAAGCGNRDRVAPRDRSMVRRPGFMRAAAPVAVKRNLLSAGARRDVAAPRPHSRRGLSSVLK